MLYFGEYVFDLVSSFSFFHDYRSSIFQSHARYALCKYLNPLWQRLSQGDVRNNLQDGGEKLIVIVDNRPSASVRFCVLNSLLMTGFKYRCIVYADGSSGGEMGVLFSDISDFVEVVDLACLGVARLDRDIYNKLLKSSHFWSALPATSVLLTQSDSLLVEPLPDYFFQYDYIGAPWTPNRTFSVPFPHYAPGVLAEYKEIWKNIVMNADWDPPHTLVGNGGHSIRGVCCMIAISSAEVSAANEPEDVFYAKNIQRYSSSLPSVLEAKRFSCETSYSFSFGSHASHLYLEACYQSEIYERHIKHVAGLYSANFA